MAHSLISVVIINYNSGLMLAKVLLALSKQTFQNFEVIIIDNCSADDSWQAASGNNVDFPFPCQLIRLDHNLGFAAGNNMAIEQYVQSDWVFLLNPDAFPEAECLNNIVQHLKQSPDVACFACTLINANNPTLLDGIGDDYHISGLHWRRGHGEPQSNIPKHPGKIFSACAAAALYRTAVFRELGGFDESYFAYSEDVDLGFRILLSGGTSLLLPEAKVHHVGSAITGRSSDFSIFHGHRNLTWTFIKNVPAPLIFFLLPFHLLMILYVGLTFAATGHLKIYLRAKYAAFKEIVPLLKQRKKIQGSRICTSMSLLKMMCWLPRSFFSK